LGAERYPEAISVALKLKDLTESGSLGFNMQSSDEIFKINATDPPEVQAQMKKAKADYEKAMKQSQESVLAGQRMTYNSVLGTAYFKQYRYNESVPYLRAMADEYKKMMVVVHKAMNDAVAQSGSYQVDSLKQMVEGSSKYVQQLSQLGGSSSQLIIAAMRANQSAVAAPYATGSLDKAVLAQMSGQFPKAEENYQASFALLKEMSAYKFASSVGDQMRKAYSPFYTNLQVVSGKLDKAYVEMDRMIRDEETTLKKNFQFFSESEKKEFFKAYNQKLERFYSLLFIMTEKNTDKTAEILDKILQTKGVILDVTRAQEKLLKKIKDKPTLDQVQQIRKLRDKLAAFYQLSLKNPGPSIADSISRTSLKISDLERKVNEKLGVVTDVLKTVSWKDVQSKLRKGEVYLEVLRLRRDNFAFDQPTVQYWGFVIKPGAPAPTLFKISEGEAFEGRGLKNYQNRIKNQLDDSESFKSYWASIKANTGEGSSLIFSGDGVYHMINPLTLKNDQSGKYLLSEIMLRRVSTGRDFLVSAPVASMNREITLIGNPAFAMSRKGTGNLYQGKEFDKVAGDEVKVRSGLSQLPGTQMEVESIQGIAVSKGMRTNILSGNQATEAGVKNLRNQQVVHIATHGEFDQLPKADGYLKAKLILAGAADAEPFGIADYSKYEDGFLTAYEVTQLDLDQTNLVVLSACETGAGEVQSGEGVWGLQRAFQLAGARTVMGSLWKISDEATATYMKSFYEKYLNGADVNEAYRSAMLKTMETYPEPYYWGAFILTGAN
ncbi:MAG TPA: CHAT domain-containing protein, partial [Cyclobacteriaceae bacterium]|nr:CHAT domain-containing protein [Cyclobacteriaceae bacterium]